jgi:hypothetical protein
MGFSPQPPAAETGAWASARSRRQRRKSRVLQGAAGTRQADR